MAAIIVQLECLTNMHVGNGDVNFNIIDNEVERDVTTGYPTINASGVKGALKEYFKKKGTAEETIKAFFGNDDASGTLKFLCADMVAVPMRASMGNAAYYLVSTKEALDAYKEKNKIFLNSELSYAPVKASGCSAEGITLENVAKVDWNGVQKDIYLMEDEDFGRMSLPVIARNRLEEGKSESLWYEEVVPHKSLFTFAVLAENADAAILKEFTDAIEGQIVQFGGNASIGYGLCKVSVLKEA